MSTAQTVCLMLWFVLYWAWLILSVILMANLLIASEYAPLRAIHGLPATCNASGMQSAHTHTFDDTMFTHTHTMFTHTHTFDDTLFTHTHL